MLTKEMLIGPATLSATYHTMEKRWSRVSAVLGGTETMRAAGQELLPKHEAESDGAYAERLSRSVLNNCTGQILDSWVGRVFSEETRLDEKTPEAVKALTENIDMLGNNLTVFLRRWFRDGVAKAFSHVLVDFPRLQSRDGVPRTLADDRAENVRPYWVAVEPESVLGAVVEVENGVEVLKQLRIYDCVIIPQADYTELMEHQIRVYEIGVVRVYAWRKDTNNRESWVLADEYAVDFAVIPLVTFYADRQGPFVGKSPIADLAELNIEHWQSASDQRAILTVARFPMLALSGTLDAKKIEVGPNVWLHCPDVQGKFYYVEHTGAAIEAGRNDLQDIEGRMANYGCEYLKETPGSQTATARALDSAEATSPLQDAALRFIDAVNQALAYTAQWLQVPEGGGAVVIELDNAIESDQTADLLALTNARTGRDVSRKTLLTELKRRGVLGEEFDFDENENELENEAALMGATDANLDPLADPTKPKPVTKKPADKQPLPK